VSGDLEAQRIKSQYRRLVLLGKARLPLGAARTLVGPDCAYHLYFRRGRGLTCRDGAATAADPARLHRVTRPSDR
jgi:hypothetical protein